MPAKDPMLPAQSPADPAARKLRGAWYTPEALVADVVEHVVTADFVGRYGSVPIRLLDPACGDGRFLLAAAKRIVSLGGTVEIVGVDVDRGAVAETRASLSGLVADHAVSLRCADSLAIDWSTLGHFDAIVGNPPFLSQMAASTTRGGSTSRSGGPYADAAVEFLALASEVVNADGGRVAFVLPQSLLSARDAGAVRSVFDERATLIWSWWTGERIFDAQVLTCALAFEFVPSASASPRLGTSWSHVVTSRSGVPSVPVEMERQVAGTLGDRARLNANFRDEYYGMIPAVGDHTTGPRLITSGLIDPGRSLWGERPITFAKQRFDRPRIDLDALDGKMPKWAADRLVPKVLIANQTKIIEAIADPDGTMLPGVPVVSAYPHGDAGNADGPALAAWEIAAVLTSPIASSWAWHRSGGTGLSADAIRLGPVVLAELPWPSGDLAGAVDALQAGDIRRCAVEVHWAYSIEDVQATELTDWWLRSLERIEARQP